MLKRQNPNGLGEGGTTAATLTRGLDILRAFRASDSTLGNQDLIDRTGLPKATISRLTATLVGLGYLHYDIRLGRYSIGPATVSLGYSALSSSAVVHMSAPLMHALAERTGVSVALGTRDGHEMVYLADSRSLAPVSLRLNVGSRLPIWSTALGLAYVAEMLSSLREDLVAKMVSAEPQRETRIREGVAAAVESSRERGFVAVFGRWYSYINAVGVAFRPTDGSPLVAMTRGGIVDMVSRESCEEVIGPALVHTVETLRCRLNDEAEPAALI